MQFITSIDLIQPKSWILWMRKRIFGNTWNVWGLRLEGQGQRARLCCRSISDSIFWLFCFIPTLFSQCNALPKKVPKRIIEKKRQQQIRDEDVSFILFFIYWVQQPFRGWGSFSWIHWNGWIPQLRCQKYVKSFHVCICPHFDISGFHKG